MTMSQPEMERTIRRNANDIADIYPMISKIDQTQTLHGRRLAGLETALGTVLTRLEGIDARFDGVDARFDGVDARFDGVDARFDGVDARFDGLSGQVGEILEILRERGH